MLVNNDENYYHVGSSGFDKAIASMSSSPHLPGRPVKTRARWTKRLHQWHWISSAISLVGMLLFALTGLTLNHAGQIEARPVITQVQRQLPATLLEAIQFTNTAELDQAPKNMEPQEYEDQAASRSLPAGLRSWLEQTLDLRLLGKDSSAEWSDDEIYLALPRPGGDAWLRIDRQSGEVEYELTQRGWIAWLNDLHKGRNTGALWSVFIDVFSIACGVFALTGLLLLQLHSANRPLTWPLVALGLLLPLLLVFLH